MSNKHGSDVVGDLVEAVVVGAFWTIPHVGWKPAATKLGNAAWGLAIGLWILAVAWITVVESRFQQTGVHAHTVLLDWGRDAYHYIASAPAGGGGGPFASKAVAIAVTVVLAVAAVALVSGILLGPLHVAVAQSTKKPKQESHGSARWGTEKDAIARGQAASKPRPQGVILGRFPKG